MIVAEPSQERAAVPARSRHVARRGWWLALAALFLIALSVRLPHVLRTMYLTPDGIEYLDIAQHLARGAGYTLSIKAYYVDDSPVIQNGLLIRPPLFTLAVTPLAMLPGWPRSVGVFNVAIGALNAVLVCLLARSFAPAAAAITAGLLAALAAPAVALSLQPMSETLTLGLMLLGLLLAGSTRRLGLAAAGAAVTLAYLARPASILVLPVAGLRVALGAGSVRARLRRGGLLWLGFGVVASAAMLWTWVAYGRLYYGSQSFLYSTPKVNTLIRGGFRGEARESPLEYITAHPDEVLVGVGQNLRDYGGTLAGDPDWAIVLVPSFPVVLLALARRRLPPAAWPLLLGAAFHLAVAIGTWATFQKRYLLPVFVFLLPVCCYAWACLPGARRRLWPNSPLRLAHVPLALLVLASGLYLARGELGSATHGPLFGDVWVGSSRAWGNPDTGRLLDWVRQQTQPDQVVGYEQPWLVTYYTARPSALLPTRLERDELERFVRETRIDVVVVDRGDIDRRAYIEWLENLGSRLPIAETQLGSYRIFATAALWR